MSERVKFWVKNPTNQNIQLIYRDVEQEKMPARVIDIPIGADVEVSRSAGGFTQKQVDAIVKHYSRAGMRRAEDVKDDYTWLVYNIGRPVPFKLFKDAVLRNATVLTNEGKVRLRETGVAMTQNIGDHLQQETRGGMNLLAAEVQVVEEKSGAVPEHKPVKERFLVSNNPEDNNEAEVVSGQRARRRASQAQG